MDSNGGAFKVSEPKKVDGKWPWQNPNAGASPAPKDTSDIFIGRPPTVDVLGQLANKPGGGEPVPSATTKMKQTQ